MPTLKDPRTKAQIAAARKRNKEIDAAALKKFTPTQKAQLRAITKKDLQQKNNPFKKQSFAFYKELGGTLTLKQIQAKKPTTKRKGC